LLAPKEDWVPGLELGSFGLSLKMLLLQFLNVNVSSWWIARHFGWKFDWLYQIVAMTGAFGIGWVACETVRWMGPILLINLPVSICIAFLVHAVLMGIFIWILPGIAGLTCDEIKVHFFQSFQFLRIKNHS